MSATLPPTAAPEVSVITDVGAPQTQSQPVPQTQETNYVTPQQFKKIQEERKHLMRLMKKRQERWSQPFSDAKIEDIQFVLEKLNEMGESFNKLVYQMQVTRKALYNKGIITEAEVQAVLDRDNERVAKANELRENTTLSVDEKKAIATEFEIPLEAIGLTETPTEGDAIKVE